MSSSSADFVFTGDTSQAVAELYKLKAAQKDAESQMREFAKAAVAGNQAAADELVKMAKAASDAQGKISSLKRHVEELREQSTQLKEIKLNRNDVYSLHEETYRLKPLVSPEEEAALAKSAKQHGEINKLMQDHAAAAKAAAAAFKATGESAESLNKINLDSKALASTWASSSNPLAAAQVELLKWNTILRESQAEMGGFAAAAARGSKPAEAAMHELAARAEIAKNRIGQIQAGLSVIANANAPNTIDRTTASLGKMNAVAMIGVSGIDDFVQQWSANGRLSEGLRGAGNNITTIAAMYGVIPGLAAIAGVTIATMWARANENSEKHQKTVKELQAEYEKLGQARLRGLGIADDEQELTKQREVIAAKNDEAASLKEARKFWRSGAPFGIKATIGAGMDAIFDYDRSVKKAENELAIARQGMEVLTRDHAAKKIKETLGDEAPLGELYGQMRAAGKPADHINERIAMEIRKVVPRDTVSSGYDQGVAQLTDTIVRASEAKLASTQLKHRLDPDAKAKGEIEKAREEAREKRERVHQAHVDAEEPTSPGGRHVTQMERDLIAMRQKEYELTQKRLEQLEEELRLGKEKREQKLQDIEIEIRRPLQQPFGGG